jgi:hypothetical protein
VLTLSAARVNLRGMMRSRRALIFVGLLTAGIDFAGCARAEAPEIGAFTSLDSPAALQSGESNLAVDGSGAVHMTWLERLSDSSVALRYARRDRDAWDTTRTIATRHDLFVNWADFPSITVTSSGRLLVHWLQRSSAGKYSYDAMLSHSSDRGRTWSAPARLHADSSASEHGFVSIVPIGDSAVAFWLDGRETMEGDGPDGGAMQVRTASISGSAEVGAESVVDGRSCDCCQTASAQTSGGPIVAYRDRSADEIRDIVVARFEAGKWSAPALVHNDGWHIEACPVNGPAIIAHGDTVAVAWFTAARDTAKVQIAFSTDAGASFGAPVRLDAGTPVGRVALTADGRGSVIVAWVERLIGDEAEVRVRLVAPDGRAALPVIVTQSSAARASGFPHLARAGDRLYASWTQSGDSAHVRIAVASLAAR